MNCRGFTLVELMVAAAITTILLLALTMTLSSTLRFWEQGRDRIETFSNARTVLQRMTDEVRGAVAARDRIEFIENAASLGGSAPVPGTSENLFFVAPYPNYTAGDLCVVAYRLNKTNHRLERAFKDSAAAWNVDPSSRFKVSGYTDLIWIALAEGVLEFETKCYSQSDLDTDAIPAPTWDSRLAAKPAMSGTAPRRVIFRLKMASDQTFAKLADLPEDSPVYKRLITQNTREFTLEASLPPPGPTPTPTPSP